MKDIPQSHDELETLGQAYRDLLEKAVSGARQTGAGLYHLIRGGGEHGAPEGEKKADKETARVGGYVRRDLVDAAHYLQSTGKELKDWLGFDTAVIEKALWDVFSEAADKTALEMLKLQMQAEAVGYETGEVVGLGTLVCDRCGERLHFHKPARIPPCPKCKHTHFHRISVSAETP